MPSKEQSRTLAPCRPIALSAFRRHPESAPDTRYAVFRHGRGMVGGLPVALRRPLTVSVPARELLCHVNDYSLTRVLNEGPIDDIRKVAVQTATTSTTRMRLSLRRTVIESGVKGAPPSLGCSTQTERGGASALSAGFHRTDLALIPRTTPTRSQIRTEPRRT
jgi:hypothetical protein